MDRPDKQLIDVSLYKETGKWYASGKAVVNHFLFEDEFKQDIVNTQNALSGIEELYVVTSAPEHVNGFFNRLFKPGDFAGLRKEQTNEQ